MKKSITKEDLYLLKFPVDIEISPSGEYILYTVKGINKKDDKYYTDMFISDRKGNKRRYTRTTKSISSPEWSPNGKHIAYIGKEDKLSGIFIFPADGGEPYKITKKKGIFKDIVWLPDNKHIITTFIEVKNKENPPIYRKIDRIMYKVDGQGFLPEDMPHIYSVNIKTGKMNQLTFGKWGDNYPAVSPDGKWIAFISNRRKDAEEKILYEDIYIIDKDGKREKKIKTPPGPKGSLTFSKDGKSIIYVGREHPELFYGWLKTGLWKVPIKGGDAFEITKGFDYPAEDLTIDDRGIGVALHPAVSQDNKWVYYLFTIEGATRLVRFSLTGNNKHQEITGGRTSVYNFSYFAPEFIAVASTAPDNPGDIFIYQGKKITRLTDLNKAYKKSHYISMPERINFKGYKGDKIEGWILKPYKFKKGKQYPLIVEVHGGPHMAYGMTFFHEFQVLAGAGYVVFYSNPHGSQGYGEKFAGAIHNDWGGPDYKDIMKAVDILEKFPYINKNKMGITGGSYGGFMTNWVIGHTNRFKAAVTQRSVVSLFTMTGTSDYGYYTPKEFSGKPWWEDPELYWKLSPLKYVKNIKTPLRIIHSEADFRCPISEAEQLYTALKILKKKVDFIRFPEEPHGLSRHGKPKRRVKRLEFILEFFNEHLTPKHL